MKLARHDKILELISREQIETQEELAKRLQAEGFQVTQATVSRDIRQLKLTKTAGSNGRSHYIVQKEAQQELGGKYIQVLKNGFSGMDTAQNLLIIHTVSGMAMAVAAALDQIHDIELIRDTIGLNSLSSELYETAVMRLRYTDIALRELGAMMNPPVGKSGMNHRFNKLKQIADEIRANKEE